MDRRMNRGYMGNNCGCNKNISSYRSEPACGDMSRGYMHEDNCDRDMGDRDYHEHHDHCEHHEDHECHEDHDIDRFPIGMCYVPWQCFRNIYENEFTALAKGTMFKELDLDWYGRGCK